MSLQSEAPPAGAEPSRSLSLAGRLVAIFVRPAQAWSGLHEHGQWWFPMLLCMLLQMGLWLPLYERAYLPMYFEQLDAQIASGAIEPAQAAKAEEIMGAKAMGPILAVVSGVSGAAITFGLALVIAFGVAFILGAKFKYRLALEVAAWSGLVGIPQQLAFTALAWSQETMKGIHFGLAAFLPEADPPAKWHTMLTVLLDAFGPFNVWFVVVAVLGCSALSGAPRRSVAWVLGGLAVALAVVSALLAGWLSPAT